MDGPYFDDWTRLLATTTGSRRAALRLLGGGVLGVVLGWRGAGEAAAACAAHAKACKGDGGCCSGFCERKGKCSKNGKLTGKCRCRCPQGTTECGTKGCCGAGEDCQGGQCVPAAGACTPACTGGQECEAGACACPDGTAGSCNSATGRVCHCCPVGLVHCGSGICRECCGDLDCGPSSLGLHCDLKFGGDGHCVCKSHEHQCTPGGHCMPCCSPEHCAADGKVGFVCTVNNQCRCADGTTGCHDGSPGGLKYYCPDYLSDKMNCGGGGNLCWDRNCINGECVSP